MVRILQIITVLALISTIAVLICFLSRLLQGAPELEWSLEPPITERFAQVRGQSAASSQVATHPLVRAADAFARYLNPPDLRESSEAKASRSPSRTTSVVIPAEISPKFTLVATSYYRSRPQESMALVREPGIGFRWVKQGTKLGRFVIDKIECGTVVYRHGNWRGEMVIDSKMPIHTSGSDRTTSISTQTGLSVAPLAIPPKRETKTDELSPDRGARSIAQDDVIDGIGS